MVFLGIWWSPGGHTVSLILIVYMDFDSLSILKHFLVVQDDTGTLKN